MEPQAKIAITPAGVFPAPMDPGFTNRLAACSTDQDLFYLCINETGYLDPDAFNEINCRGLAVAFNDWIEANAQRVEAGFICRAGEHMWRCKHDAVRCCDGIHTRNFGDNRTPPRWSRSTPIPSI